MGKDSIFGKNSNLKNPNSKSCFIFWNAEFELLDFKNFRLKFYIVYQTDES